MGRPYRAFREFDGMTDEACARYLWVMRRQGHIRAWVPAAVAVVAVPFSCVLTGLSVPFLVDHGFAGVMRALDRVRVGERAWGGGFSLGDAVLAAVNAFGAVGLPGLAGLLARDWQIRRALRRKTKLVRCAQCRQSLIGLPVESAEAGPRTRCPECGTLWLLGELDLTPEDLAAGSASAEA